MATATTQAKNTAPSASITTTSSSNNSSKLSPLVVLNIVLLLLSSGGPLLIRVYFVHGGRSLWLSTLIQICGWPLLLVPMVLRRRRLHLSLPLLAAAALLGLLFGLCSYVYSLGSAVLPLSTSSILISTQLAFTALFAFVLVRQRFTPYSANAVVLLTIGPAVLGLGGGSVRPDGETAAKYWAGFAEMIGAAAIGGLILPMVEYSMARWGRRRGEDAEGSSSVLETQAVIGMAATVFCLIGMAVSNEFKAIPREAREFGLGKTKYYLVLVWDIICWQLMNLGLVGLISCSSSLLAGIMIAVLLPLSQVLSVVFLHEKFDGSKGIALVISLWGFVSYLYGERRQSLKNAKQAEEVELAVP